MLREDDFDPVIISKVLGFILLLDKCYIDVQIILVNNPSMGGG